MKLLEDFGASALVRDPTTKENLLHVLFQMNSSLRFDLVSKYSVLIHQVDCNGDTPMFIAAKQEDTVFFHWLFEQFSRPESVSPSNKAKSSAFKDLPNSPLMSEVSAMQPFKVSRSGNSIIHILAQQGCHEILAIFKRVCSYEGFDFSSISMNKGPMPMPIVLAFTAQSLCCVEILLDLAIQSNQLQKLIGDENVLKRSVNSKNINVIKALIQHGFHKGTNLAIILASSIRCDDILGLLIFWYTQVQFFFEFVQSQKISRVVSVCKLMWQQLNLLYVHPSWLFEVCNAMSLTATLCNEMLQRDGVVDVDITYIEKLGQKCLEYFDNKTSLSLMLSESAFFNIAAIDLSDNLLRCVPIEIFNLTSLTSLDLSCNEIRSLPLSSSSHYAAKLERLTLRCNQITTLPDDLVWSFATSLQELDLSNNQLKNIPTGLWLIPTLQEVNLAYNKLTQMHYLSVPLYFQNAKFLEKVSLFDSSLNHSDNDEFEMCKMVMHMKRLSALYYTINAVKFPNKPKLSEEAAFSDILEIYKAKANIILAADIDFCLPFLTSSNADANFPSKLAFLDISNNNFVEIPWDLPCLAPNLEKLLFKSNCVGILDVTRDFPCSSRSLMLSGNKIMDVCQERQHSYPCGHPIYLLSASRSCNDKSYCKHCQHESLEKLSILNLDQNFLEYLPVLKLSKIHKDYSISETELSGNKNLSEHLLFPNMASLSLENNNFFQVPGYLYLMQHLGTINLSYNPISELPEDMGLINIDHIMTIKLDGIAPKNVPENLMVKPIVASNLIEFLRDLKQK